MKIDSKHISELLKELHYRMNGLLDTIQSGDDGYIESLKEQIQDVKKQMNTFSSQHMPIYKNVQINLNFRENIDYLDEQRVNQAIKATESGKGTMADN